MHVLSKNVLQTQTSCRFLKMFKFVRLFILQDFLMELFLLFRELLSNNIFPKDWMVMTMVQNRY